MGDIRERKALESVLDAPPENLGTSHLRSIADGFVGTPADLSVGVLSVPGACASHLLTEVRNAVVQRPPDVVVLLAPGNDLTGYKTIAAAGADFAKLLHCLLERWTEVRYLLHYVAVYVIMLSLTFGEMNLLNIYCLGCRGGFSSKAERRVVFARLPAYRDSSGRCRFVFAKHDLSRFARLPVNI
ncbi:hypothetical protein EYF80_068221 [Liparis tanakae]|uniref:Uncharacterized protein n=1 Tax=Liparis tanakae TaxID=230148 RepID=A0A4Z2DZ05_9TELE|nr:hypothetical protein EYF80_068221 [Liparis tanakae]